MEKSESESQHEEPRSGDDSPDAQPSSEPESLLSADDMSEVFGRIGES